MTIHEFQQSSKNEALQTARVDAFQLAVRLYSLAGREGLIIDDISIPEVDNSLRIHFTKDEIEEVNSFAKDVAFFTNNILLQAPPRISNGQNVYN
jgi:hypothetical protein